MKHLRPIDRTQKKILYNGKLNCIIKIEWNPTETLWDPKLETNIYNRWDA